MCLDANKNICTERVNIFFLDALLIVAQGVAGLKSHYSTQQSSIGYGLFS
jgi:hypothetical protein